MADIEGLRTAMHAAVDSEKASADELIGLVRRRHRRHQWHVALAGAAALIALAVAIPAGLGAIGQPPKPEQPPAAPTLYIYSWNPGGGYTGPVVDNTVTPINTATGTPGKQIHVGRGFLTGPGWIAITPDGKTVYVTGPGTVTPINTATGTPGTPIHIGRTLFFGNGMFSENIAITPDGKIVYVLDQAGRVTPISTATNTPGRPIHVGGSFNLAAGNIVITPDGKTAYATTNPVCDTASCPGRVTPISTATNTPGAPIKFTVTTGGATGSQIAITPDGKTAYVTTGPTVTPIKTATNTPGRPIHVGGLPSGSGQIVITPDGKTAYVLTGSGVTPISTATNTPGRPIHVALAGAFAITP